MKKSLIFKMVMLLCLGGLNYNTVIAQAPPSGYERPIIISDSDAYKYATAYKNANGGNSNPNLITGGVITRESFDAILSVNNCNAITCKLCMDPEGIVAPKNAVFIVVSGAKASEKDGSIVVDEIGALKYRGNDWCPPSCMKFTITNVNTGQPITVE